MISSFCSGGDCVDVERLPTGDLMVTSTRSAEHFIVTPAEWAAFIAGVKAGDFDQE